MVIRFLFAALILFAVPALAQNAKPVLIKDPRTGCAVWNLYPGPTDSITWSGACAKGLAQGRGTLQWFVDGKPFVRYEGEYRDGKENGRGVSSWADNARFEGEYRNGLPNGNGTYRSAKDDIYTGNWINGCFKQGTRWATAHTTAVDCGFK